MWTFTLRVPDEEPKIYILKSGRNTMGRKLDNDLAIKDTSASRLHAVAYFDELQDLINLSDVGSTNGTFVNRERISGTRYLEDEDIIRIGGSTITVHKRDPKKKSKDYSGSHRYTRELLLEALDHHAVLMYEVAHQLNTVMDIDTALNEVSNLMRRAMGADRCEVILAEEFNMIVELGFPASIAESAIEQRSAVVIPDLMSSKIGKASKSANLLRIRSLLCVPVMSGEDVIALIYLFKTGPESRPFDQRDLQLAVAISHQASLTIQRMRLIQRVGEEQRGRELLLRFLSPQEAEFMLPDYLENGQLPGLTEKQVSILFVDIQDSTGLADALGAKGFGEILNRFYWDVTDLIFENGGLVKFAGDGIMAVFGMTVKPEGHERCAINTGLSILNHISSADYGDQVEINVGVGVNTGMAMVGYVGTQQRVELTALGYSVNVAHSLQVRARPNRILIGPETAAGVTGKLPLSDLGEMVLKGRTKPLRVYEILRQVNLSDDQVIEL